MKPNVFLLQVFGPLGSEDRLTAFWHYVLSVVPGLGQAFVDHVCDRAEIPRTTYIGAIDHPTGDRGNHPDLLIRCNDCDFLFEHKLDSPLGEQQLHRYLALAESKGWKVGLLAAQCHDIDDVLCQSPLFIRPRDVSPPHFLWQDVHEIVSKFTDHLAREFNEYLEALGLGRFDWVGLGNPLIDEEAAAELRSLYAAAAQVFRGTGASCRTRGNSLVYEIRKPFPPIHLINVSPVSSVADWDRRLWGPVMAVSVWVRRDGDSSERILPSGKGHVRGSDPQVFITDTVPVRPAHYDKNLHLEREYYVPLDAILRESKAVSQERLLAFLQVAVDHLKGRRTAET